MCVHVGGPPGGTWQRVGTWGWDGADGGGSWGWDGAERGGWMRLNVHGRAFMFHVSCFRVCVSGFRVLAQISAAGD